MVICLEHSADLHKAQLMPMPHTVSCFSKIQIGFTFLVPAHLGSPGKRAVKRVCVLCVVKFLWFFSNFACYKCTHCIQCELTHHTNCLFHHSGSQPSVDTHFQSLHRSSATHCRLTSNHPRLCPSSVNVLKHPFSPFFS